MKSTKFNNQKRSRNSEQISSRICLLLTVRDTMRGQSIIECEVKRAFSNAFMCFVIFLFRVDVYIRMWQLEIRLFVGFATSSRYVLLSIVCYLVMTCSTISIH